jgi:serine/threonine protein kinase
MSVASENILLDARGIAKLSDFGVSHMFEDSAFTDTDPDSASDTSSVERLPTKLSTPSPGLTRRDTETALEMKPMADHGLINKTEGTYAFWSPEMCEGSSAFSGYAADIWAAGVCLYIMVTGKLPFYITTPMELLEVIKEAK